MVDVLLALCILGILVLAGYGSVHCMYVSYLGRFSMCFAIGKFNILTWRSQAVGCGLIFGKETLTKLTWSHSESVFAHVSELRRNFSYLLAVCVCSCKLGSSLLVRLKPYVTLHVVAVSCRLIIRLDYFVLESVSRANHFFKCM